jgi:hypothetical protein
LADEPAEPVNQYEDDPRHRRAKLPRITRTGGTALRRIEAAQRTWADALGAEVGEGRLRKASATLDPVLAALADPELAAGRRAP